MGQEEWEDCIAYMDLEETIIRADKARELATNSGTEDAIAYAMAAGFRMGWDAHKKKVEEEK